MSEELNNIESEKKEYNSALKKIQGRPEYDQKENAVLIIDDDQWMQKITSRYLESWGFNTYSALNAFEGVALAVKFKPVFIILDIIMPEVRGDVVLKMLKYIENTEKIPVIIVSGNLDANVFSSTYKSGAVGYITKPFTKDTLLDKIKECIDLSNVNNPNIKIIAKEQEIERKERLEQDQNDIDEDSILDDIDFTNL